MILVTGASGRLGKEVVRILLTRGDGVLGTDILPNPNSPCRFVQLDLRDRDGVSRLMREVTAVIHLGAIPGPGGTLRTQASDRAADAGAAKDLIFENNVLSTFNILTVAAEKKVRRVVFSSSAFAVGWAHDPRAFVPLYLPLDEEHPLMPFEPYGLSKQVGECIAGMVARTGPTSVVSLRFCNVIPLERHSELPWPAPTPDRPLTLVMWAYADPRDVAEAHVRALDADLQGHETFLLAQPITRFRESTEELIHRNFGDRVPIRQPLHGNESIISTKKAQRLLGFQPRHRW